MQDTRPKVLSELTDITALISGVEFHCKKASEHVADMQSMFHVRHRIMDHATKYADSIDELTDLRSKAVIQYKEAEKKLDAVKQLGEADVGQLILHAEAWKLVPSYSKEIENGFNRIDDIYGRY